MTNDIDPPGDQAIPDAAAVVLAGGKSSRMGRPKSLLPFGNEPLIARIVGVLQRIFPEIVVVAAPDQDLPSLPVPLVRDEVAYQGPVGGIYYGLKATGGKFSFVTSCDAVFLNPRLITYLIPQIRDCDIVVPWWEERFQPLHAVYRREVVPLLQGQLERGELRPIYLFDKVRTRKVGEEEIRAFDPEGLSFFNMNTPEDYARALERWNELPSADGGALTSSVTCTVELFGMAQLLAKTKNVSLVLPQEATLAQLFAALAEQLPILVGRVINREKSELVGGYACNMNGLEFVRNPTVKVKTGDRVLILSADAGG